MMKQNNFNKIEEKILRILFQNHLSMSVYEIAKESKISYPTAKKYLIKLSKLNLTKIHEGKPTKYSFNFELLFHK